MRAAVWLVCVVGLVPAGLRWLRVAQREHYAAPMVIRFGLRWWSLWPNQVLFGLGVVGIVVGFWIPPAGFVTAAVGIAAPVGLAIRGVSSELRWTPRLLRLTTGVVVLTAAALAVGALIGWAVPAAAALLLALPIVVDLALLLMGPVERRLSRRWVKEANQRLRRVEPIVVAITGSYGKTTTKAFVAQLIAGRYDVVASPASFNNEMGLSRAINEHLGGGTEVFVAEMGTYGPGELASLVSWIRPTISVITSIGPVHLERFRTIDRVVSAKAEILHGAEVAVLNVDSPELASLADTLEGVEVVRCSASDPSADVCVDNVGRLLVGGDVIAHLPASPAFAANLACAAAVAHTLKVPLDNELLGSVEPPEHRRQELTGEAGFRIIDDTYNSNPAGASAAVAQLSSAAGGRRVVVTPGIVELGHRQAAANRDLAEDAASVATDLLVVGHTNRRALLEGAEGGGASVKLVASRQEAVEWVRRHLGPGDVVLYENDLPDHYP